MGRQPAGPGAPDGGTLFIVSTPIGNLGDMTLRAIDTLKSADLVLAEDTRTSRVLLQHYGIRVPVMAAHAHNEARLIPRVLERLNRGERIALVTDAGTPLVSDPGSRLVRSAREAGFRVTPVPGPSALTAALSAAGVDSTRFTFFGFLPRRGGARREALQALSALGHTGVLYEAPGRVTETLRELSEVGAGDRRCVVARELTKKFEEFREGTVAELAAFYGGNPPRGEVVILVAGGESKLFSEADLRHRVRKLREDGLSARDIAARLAAETGAARNVVYRMALES